MKLAPTALAALLATASTAQTPAWKLTPSGWGPVHISMTREQVQKTLKVELEGEAFDNEDSCIELSGANNALPGFYFTFMDGRLSRISIRTPSTATTPRDIGIGATADDVRKAYGPALKAEPHHYKGEPAEYLTYWLRPNRDGVRFDTDTNRRVQAIHVGDGDIQAGEGCI